MKVIGFMATRTPQDDADREADPAVQRRGLNVSTVKNAHHGFDMDRPGKDSFRYREAGSQQC